METPQITTNKRNAEDCIYQMQSLFFAIGAISLNHAEAAEDPETQNLLYTFFRLAELGKNVSDSALDEVETV
jgi:hypothetical protein